MWDVEVETWVPSNNFKVQVSILSIFGVQKIFIVRSFNIFFLYKHQGSKLTKAKCIFLHPENFVTGYIVWSVLSSLCSFVHHTLVYHSS